MFFAKGFQKMMRIKVGCWALSLSVGAAVATLVSGCAGYRLGSMLPPDIKTVYVPTCRNQTTEPLVDVETTQALLRQLQIDGSLRVVSEAEADSVLEVTVTDFSMSPRAFSKESDRATFANEYRVFLTAKMVLKRRATDEVIVEDASVRGDSTFILAGDMTSSKRLALPEVAEDLARRIIDRVVEVW